MMFLNDYFESKGTYLQNIPETTLSVYISYVCAYPYLLCIYTVSIVYIRYITHVVVPSVVNLTMMHYIDV